MVLYGLVLGHFLRYQSRFVHLAAIPKQLGQTLASCSYVNLRAECVCNSDRIYGGYNQVGRDNYTCQDLRSKSVNVAKGLPG